MAKFSPFAAVGELPVGEVRWTRGFWAGRVECCRASMIPAMWDILSNDGLSHAFANFRIAAGLEDGEHSGPPFFDGDLYKWLESVASVYAATKATELDAPEREPITVFTNRDGRFGLAGLKPGRWKLEMLTTPATVYMITIPDGTIGALKVGDVGPAAAGQ